MYYWYALHTKPHKERQVEAVLTERNIEVYYPTLPAARPRRNSATQPFFPRYLFAHADLEEVGLWPLHYTPGMAGVVMFGGVPARVNDSVIDCLRERLALVNPVSRDRRAVVDANGKVIHPGDRVVIASGPLAEMEAVFDRRLSSAGRVRVLIQLLKRWTAVEMDADALRKAGVSLKT